MQPTAKTCEQAQALTQELSCANHNSERQLKTHFQRTLDVQIHKTGSTKTWLGESEFFWLGESESCWLGESESCWLGESVPLINL